MLAVFGHFRAFLPIFGPNGSFWSFATISHTHIHFNQLLILMVINLGNCFAINLEISISWEPVAFFVPLFGFFRNLMVVIPTNKKNCCC